MVKTLIGLEYAALLLVGRMGPNAAGFSIIQEYERCLGRQISRGATYTALVRLEKKGMVKSSMGKPLPKVGGRANRLYQITGDGRKLLLESQKLLDFLKDGGTA